MSERASRQEQAQVIGRGDDSHVMAGSNSQWEAYLREIRGEPMVRSARTASLVLFVINTLTSPLDFWVGQERFSTFLGVRVALNAVLAVIYLGAAWRWPLPSALAGCFAACAMLLTVVHGTGGPSSDYYVGLILMQVGAPVLLPLQTRLVVALNGFLILGYILPASFSVPRGEWLLFVVHAFFVLGAALTSITSAALLERMRFREFVRRREVEEARDQLAELDVAKSRFTANVHHELRTPLTLMLAPLDAMLSGAFGAVSELQRQYLQTMHTNARRLLKLINNLLDLARIEGEQLRITRLPTAIGPVVGELVDGARPLAERKQVRIETRGLDELPELNVDPEALEKIVVNLLGNALKFTDPGGRIEVRGEPQEGGAVRLTVEDSGLGIPPDQLERIFDRFAQVDASGTRRHEGTGIGLSLVRELVNLHGGRVWAESEGRGRGSRLRVWLPRGEADAERLEEVLEAPAGDLASLGNSISAMEGELGLERSEGRFVQLEQSVERAGFAADAGGSPPGFAADGEGAPPAPRAPDAARVLVVEDNADMRRLLAFLLGREFHVDTAPNGRRALERLRERRPELVLTDLMMPEMSGTELCRAIKSDPETQHIPVVLVTSKAEREMKVQGLELGADDYVTKPFHPRELMARVRSLVRLRRLQEELSQRNAALEATLAELKEAHVQLVQAERLAAVGELAAGVAHEVNNPVNFATNALKTLRSYVEEVRQVCSRIAALDLGDPQHWAAQRAELEKLRRELDLDDVVASLAELVAIVTEGLDRTGKLVSDLRDFAAPGDGPRADVDLRRSLESTLQLVGHALRSAGVEVTVESEPCPQVRGDARALNQVFLNLLKNAAEALEGRGGSVRVRIHREGAWIHVEFRDDGPGIAPAVQTRLFEPFFTTKGAGRGTGLGLSISRRILVEHGGSIEVESTPGEGACFTLKLPVGERSDAPQA